MSRKRWEDNGDTNGDLESTPLVPGTKIEKTEQKKVCVARPQATLRGGGGGGAAGVAWGRVRTHAALE